MEAREHSPVAPLAVDTALRPVDELDPKQRDNLEGFVAMVRVLAALAALLFAVPLLLAVAALVLEAQAARAFVVTLTCWVAVPALLALEAHRGLRLARLGAPFHQHLRRLLWILSLPAALSLLNLALLLLHLVVVGDGDTSLEGLRSVVRTSFAMTGHVEIVQGLASAALLWGPAYPIVAVVLSGQAGLRSLLRGALWFVALVGWGVVIAVDPLRVSQLF